MVVILGPMKTCMEEGALAWLGLRHIWDADWSYWASWYEAWRQSQHSGRQSELMSRSWPMEKMSEICIPRPWGPLYIWIFVWWDNILSFFPYVMFRWDFVPCDRKSQLLEQETILSPVLWSPGRVLPALTSFSRMWIELERNHWMCPFDSNSGSCLGRQSFHQDHPSTHPYFRLPVSTGLS